MDADGRLVTAKAPSTPDDFSEGVMESLRLAAERLTLTTEALLRDTARLALGTTVGTNAMLQRRGARVGLITTRGHRDVIHIMRGARGVPGLNNVQVLHFPESGKPDPIVPKPFIAEVSERVDCKGQVVVELNEDEARQAIEKLVAKGVEAIAICFLWSFKHAEHERRVKAMVEQLAPQVFVCCSADLIPRWGEYERTVATVLNAYLGPVMSRYLGRRGGGELPERRPPVRILRPTHRHPLDRKRRRLDRLDRRRERHDPRWADLGRSPARSRVLRARRHAADGDRRRSHARLSRSR